MTKAKALRNYFKQVYGVDNLTGMSELAVWKEFLKENSNFDSLSSTMTGLYTEMTDNEISLGGGSNEKSKFFAEFIIGDRQDDFVVRQTGESDYIGYIKFPRNNIVINDLDFILTSVTYDGEPEYEFGLCNDPWYVDYDDTYIYIGVSYGSTEESAEVNFFNREDYYMQVGIYATDFPSGPPEPQEIVIFSSESIPIADLTNSVSVTPGTTNVNVPIPCNVEILPGDSATFMFDNGMTGTPVTITVGGTGSLTADYENGNLYLIISTSSITTDEQARAWFVPGVDIFNSWLHDVYSISVEVTRI